VTPAEEMEEIVGKGQTYLRILWWMTILSLLTMIAGFLAPFFYVIQSLPPVRQESSGAGEGRSLEQTPQTAGCLPPPLLEGDGDIP
jgi:hypothetical protein